MYQNKKYIFKILPVLIVTIITWFVWGNVLNQSLLGEGAIYFVEPYLSMIEKGGFAELWTRHDVQALIFFNIFRDIFRDNVLLYMITLLIGVNFVAITVFFITKKVTNSTIAGLMGSMLLVTNFVGSFEILGIGYYQWFIQRVPNFGLALVGFYFLILYFKKNRISYYSISAFLYIMAVYLSRYTIHILPLFVVYIFIQSREVKRTIVLSLPLVIGSYVLMKAQTLVNPSSFAEFLQNGFTSLQSVFSQISLLTFPFALILPTYSMEGVIKLITPVIIVVYFFSYRLVLKSSKNLGNLATSLLLAIPVSIYLSIFLNPYFANFYTTSRYLYYTSILISIYWGLVFGFFWKKGNLWCLGIVVFIAMWFGFNKYHILKNFNDLQERHDPVVATINYTRQNFMTFPDDSTIIVPPQLSSYVAGMLNYSYKNKGLKLIPNIDSEKKPDSYILLQYDTVTREIVRKNVK